MQRGRDTLSTIQLILAVVASTGWLLMLILPVFGAEVDPETRTTVMSIFGALLGGVFGYAFLLRSRKGGRDDG
jgi:hypothetical protein